MDLWGICKIYSRTRDCLDNGTLSLADISSNSYKGAEGLLMNAMNSLVESGSYDLLF